MPLRTRKLWFTNMNHLIECSFRDIVTLAVKAITQCYMLATWDVMSSNDGGAHSKYRCSHSYCSRTHYQQFFSQLDSRIENLNKETIVRYHGHHIRAFKLAMLIAHWSQLLLFRSWVSADQCVMYIPHFTLRIIGPWMLDAFVVNRRTDSIIVKIIWSSSEVQRGVCNYSPCVTKAPMHMEFISVNLMVYQWLLAGQVVKNHKHTETISMRCTWGG